MKCERCLSGKEAQYRAYTDIMELNICATCAVEARRLGISLAVLVHDNPPSDFSDGGPASSKENAKSVSSKREGAPWAPKEYHGRTDKK